MSTDTDNKILEKKVVLAGLTVLLSALLLWCGHLEPANFQEIAIWVIGLAIAGDTASQWAGYMGTKYAALSVPQPVSKT